METDKKQARSLRKLVTVTPLIDAEMLKHVGEDLLRATSYLSQKWTEEFGTEGGVLPPQYYSSLARLRLLMEVFNNLKYGKPDLCITDKHLWEQAEEEKNKELRDKKAKAEQATMAKIQKLLDKINKEEDLSVEKGKGLFPDGFILLPKGDKTKRINKINSIIYPEKGLYVLPASSMAPPVLIEKKYLKPDPNSGCQCASCKFSELPNSVSKGLTYSNFCDALLAAQEAAEKKGSGVDDAAA